MRGAGRIYRRGRIYWIDYWCGGHNYRESSRSALERDARELLRKRLAEVNAGRPAPRGKATVAELIADLETDYKLNGRKSLYQMQGHARPVLAVFGPDPAEEVTTPRIQRYVQQRLEERLPDGTIIKRSPAKINRELAVLRRALALGRRHGRTGAAPVVPTLKEANARTGFFERAEVLTVMAHLPPDLADLVDWAFLTGMRKGEVVTLTWDTIQGEELRLADSKNGERRVIPLVGLYAQVIARRQRRRLPGCELIFHWSGKPIQQFRRHWARACSAAGLAGRLFHDLRRSGVRSLVRAGVPRRVAMAISGHKLESVFERYNIVDGSDLRSAAHRLGEFLGSVQNRDNSGTISEPAKT